MAYRASSHRVVEPESGFDDCVPVAAEGVVGQLACHARGQARAGLASGPEASEEFRVDAAQQRATVVSRVVWRVGLNARGIEFQFFWMAEVSDAGGLGPSHACGALLQG